MARNLGPVCRMCRREGLKLFLKGERCYTDKCAIERRNYPPGAHGQARTRFSEFAIRLREKQKVKRIYGMLEKQFAQYFEMAERMPGITGENLLVLLERRLDNVGLSARLFEFARAGAPTRSARPSRSQRQGRDDSLVPARGWAGRQHQREEPAEEGNRRGDRTGAAARRALVDVARTRAVPRLAAGRCRRASDLTMPISEKLIVEHYSR